MGEVEGIIHDGLSINIDDANPNPIGFDPSREQ